MTSIMTVRVTCSTSLSKTKSIPISFPHSGLWHAGLWRDGVKVTYGFCDAVLPVRIRAPASILKGVSCMKKKLVSLVLCMALLSSFTISASAEFDNTDSSNLFTLTKYCASLYQNATFRNSTYNNWCYMLGDALTDVYNVNSGLVQRVIEIQSKIDASNQHLGIISSSLGTIDSHIGSGFQLCHEDLTSFQQLVDQRFAAYQHSNNPDGVFPYSSDYRDISTGNYTNFKFSWGEFLGNSYLALTKDALLYADGTGYRRSLYGLILQLQQVLASDDDLQLKNDNKANEDAATDAFVNGSSSKTSLGTGDIGNLKDVGGTFNDLTSLNGQSSVSSFLSGLTSADGTGQGWFSEATRASLDAVSTSVTTTKLVQKTWRGEKSLVYSISADTSLNVVASPAPARAPAADPDPYNMSGFDDNYNWLWGDVS